MKTILLTAFALVITLTGCAQDGVKQITATQLEEAMKNNIVLVDVRTPEEFLTGHIGHAVNADWYSQDFMTRMEKLDKNQPVYLYCRSGTRSTAAASRLLKAGFREVYSLDGGINRWTGAHKPVVK